MSNKVFTGKQKQRFVQNILEINQLLTDNPNALNQKQKRGGIFSKSNKKADKSQISKHIVSNKFYIKYKPKDDPTYFSQGNKQQEKEDETDREVLYECNNVETASYIVAKIKAQIRLNQN